MIIKRPAVVIDKSPRAESFVSIATYVPILRWRDVLKAARLSNRVEVQIKQTPGAIAYSLAVNPLRRQFWTCSTWTDRASMKAFVQAEPHATAVTRFAEWAAPGAAFTEWDSEQPRPDWREAFRRLKQPQRDDAA